MRFTLAPNDFGGQLQTVDVGAGASQTVAWPTTDGWYDVSVGANGPTERIRRPPSPTASPGGSRRADRARPDSL